MDQQDLQAWTPDQIVEGLEKQIESDVPFEHRKELQPFIAELKNRVGYFTGTLTASQVGSGSTQGSPA
jgi:hypothetical protein